LQARASARPGAAYLGRRDDDWKRSATERRRNAKRTGNGNAMRVFRLMASSLDAP
jgi:hypothetical protein